MAIGEESTLPPGWVTGQANDGRTFYINHASKTTTWEHPGTAAPLPASSNVKIEASAPASIYPVASVAAFKAPQAGATPEPGSAAQLGGRYPLLRKIFWVTAGLGWVVWIFSVSSAGDQNWMTIGGNGVGIDETNNACDGSYANDSACTAYEAFVGTQILATIVCSVTVVIYTVAFFRPFEAKFASAKVLGLVGGILMAFSTFFQMLAFIFASKRVEENNEVWGAGVFERGATFGVGVTTFVFGFVQAAIILFTFQVAGDGPLLLYAQRLETPNDVVPVPAYPQAVASTLPAPQPEANMEQGSIPANPSQPHDSDVGPPPYDSPDLGPYPSQPNNENKGSPPAYDSADLGSNTV